MKKLTILVWAFCLFFATTGLVQAQPPTIDGVITPGEWDGYSLGTSAIGDMSVAVCGFQDGTYLYSAYKADITMAGWATACSLSINLNPYFKTPQSASWPDMGYTVFEMVYPRYMQTDGSDWDEVNAVSLPDGIVEYGFTDLYATTEAACLDGTGDNH